MARNDFNGDGLSDLFWQNWDGPISSWLGSGGGHFVLSKLTDGGDGGVYAIGDFGADGRADALFVNSLGQLTALAGQTDGSFVAHHLQARAAEGWQPNVFGDFNGDGRTDLLWELWTPTDRAVSIWLATSTGDFVLSPHDPFTAFARSNPNVWLAGDFDGNGRDEVLWWDYDSGMVGSWQAQAGGDLQIDFNNVVGRASSGWVVLDTGDFNGDGRDDLLWQLQEVGSTSVWLGTADGGFVLDGSRQNHADLRWFFGDVGDYNGDGRDDVLWLNSQGRMAEWLSASNSGFVVNNVNNFLDTSSAWLLMPW